MTVMYSNMYSKIIYPVYWVLSGMAVWLFPVGLYAGLIEEIRLDTQRLSAYESRVTGTPGHSAASKQLLDAVNDIGNVKVFTQSFPAIMPQVEKAELTVLQGMPRGTYRIYPIWPDCVRLKNTTEAGINGLPVYIGDGALSRLPAKGLRGQIAVLEMKHYENWQRPFDSGATALLLLGGPDDQLVLPRDEPLFKPRFYIPQGPLAEAFRKGAVREISLYSRSSWQDTTAQNIYVLLKGKGSLQHFPPVIVAVPYDAMSIVLGLAPGADNAVDAAFLLNMIRYFSKHRPLRTVLFAFIDAYGINQLGVRQMLAMLSITANDKTRQQYEQMDRMILKKYEILNQQVRQIEDRGDALLTISDKKN